MLRVRRDAGFTLGFAALALVIAFWQRPGLATSDTKIDLHVDPLRFLGDVASVWTPTNGLGEVHSAQYGGYLWPMGPFFALFHELGISPWVVQRLWFALVLFLAAWGLLRLLDELIGRPRGIVHLVATAFFIINPYTVVFTARTTITLWGYAALPWLLLAVHRGVRTQRGWRAWWWPAAFALMFMSTGGGVNAAVVFYMAVGPVLLMIYEPAMGHVRWRDAGAFFGRAVLLSLLASLWWISALLVHVRYGIDFLQYTEQPRTIWGTNGISESIRLMGYWTSYIGAGYPKPGFSYFSDGGTLLFNVPVVLASFLLPALAILAFVWARRWRYASFFVLMIVVGVTIMAAGFPDGTPLRSSMEWIYYHVFVTRFLRTTDKAAPLLALGLACLLGLGAKLGWDWLRARGLSRWRTPALIAAPTALAALILVAAWPLVEGKAIDSQLTWKQIPTAWRQVGHALDRGLATNTRAVVLPGDVFAYYKWGGTVDSILPRLTKRPVAIRYETPYADLHADDLLQTIDSLVQQNRAYPGQLAAPARPDWRRLRRAGTRRRHPARRRGRSLRSRRSRSPRRTSGRRGGTAGYPRSRRPRATSGRPGGCRRCASTRSPGAAGSSTSTRAGRRSSTARRTVSPTWRRSGRCRRTRRSSTPGDLGANRIAGAAKTGSNLVVTDSNRRAFFLPQFTQQNVGPVLTQTDPITKAEADVNPFPSAGSAGQTVTVLQGVRYLTGPYANGFESFPEHVPAAAFDGNLSTAWVPYGDPQPDRWFRVGL